MATDIWWRESWKLLTTLQPGQSGPFSHVLRRAWIPPPHWAVQRSQGPQPVQNTWGGHNKCSLQYLWEEKQGGKESIYYQEKTSPTTSLICIIQIDICAGKYFIQRAFPYSLSTAVTVITLHRVSKHLSGVFLGCSFVGGALVCFIQWLHTIHAMQPCDHTAIM